MSTVQTQVGRFVWHESWSTDAERAKSFYTGLLGWDIEVWKPGEADYAMISVGGKTHGGFWPPPEGGGPSLWLGHVLVEDVDAAVGRAQAGGGTVVVGPMDVPEVGRFAVIRDPQGAVVSAFQPQGEAPAAEGVFLWDELWSADVEASKRFYGEVFGWTTADMDMGDMVYTIFRRAGDTDTAGLLAKPDEVPASVWVPYLATDDVDATAAKAGELGGTVTMGPMDVPNVGRLAVLLDPTGAPFGLFKPSEMS